MKKRTATILMIFSMFIITLAVWRYSDAAAPAVAGAFALLTSILADVLNQGVVL